MCGIGGIVGNGVKRELLEHMRDVQRHRGPDDNGIFVSPDGKAGLMHNRLSILDLSKAGKQPMADATGRYYIVFNGEIYNYLEIKTSLESEFSFHSQTDTEVILYAYQKWGEAMLDRLIGMFSLAIWDEKEKVLWAARDRFGVKPFNYAVDGSGNFIFASEIKTLHAAGINKEMNEAAWAAFLAYGRYDHDANTFWEGIYKLPAGHSLSFRQGKLSLKKWYDLADKSGLEMEHRSLEDVTDEYYALLQDTIKLRFRADVPVGINLSGGLDSSALLSLVDKVKGTDNQVKAFTFITGDERYDELPWVRQMIEQTRHPLIPCLLRAQDIPELAASVSYYEDEPFGGIPTLAYAHLFEEARKNGVIVLLDGQGMDEQWAGYDYYAQSSTNLSAPAVQGAKNSAVLAHTLQKEFLDVAPGWQTPEVYPDKLRNLQYRDAFYTKIPRALRFNDRISMRSSTELREPFLDHRLFELAFRQPVDFKIRDGKGKWFMRQLLKKHLPGNIVEAPKRPLQTPQREWLREDLKDWTYSMIESALQKFPHWLQRDKVMKEWQNYLSGGSDNSFYIWQWISLGLVNTKK